MSFYWITVSLVVFLLRETTLANDSPLAFHPIKYLLLFLVLWGVAGKLLMLNGMRLWYGGYATGSTIQNSWRKNREALHWLALPAAVVLCRAFEWEQIPLLARNLSVLALTTEMLLWFVPFVLIAAILDWLDFQWHQFLEEARRELDPSSALSQPRIDQFMWNHAKHTWIFVLLPILSGTTYCDLMQWIIPGWRESVLSGLVWSGLIAFASLFMPTILAKLWSVRSPREPYLADRLNRIKRQPELPFHEVRLWDTGFRFANAAAVGWRPNFRLLLLTDRLLQELSDEELQLVLLHESAHAKRYHSLLRLVPIILTVLILSSPITSISFAATSDDNLNSAIKTLFQIGLYASLLGFLCAVARWTEYDADRWACAKAAQDEQRKHMAIAVDNRHAATILIGALRKMEQSSGKVWRFSLLHPATESRRKWLEKCFG